MRKKWFFSVLSVLLILALCACNGRTVEKKKPSESKTKTNDVIDSQSTQADLAAIPEIDVQVGKTVLTATLYDNSAAWEFADLLRKGDLTLSLHDYGNFEKTGDLPQKFTASDEKITATTGDIVLYKGNQISLIYGSNQWSYTRLGKIKGVTKAELLSVLGSSNVAVTFRLHKEDAAKSGKVLVAYFSATGTTKTLAQYVREAVGADLYEITPAVPYTEADLAYYTDCRADREQSDPSARPAISGSISNMDEYDVIFIGYPIWHSQAPRIISTFLESYDFSGKTVIPFCTSHSSGIGSSDTNLHTLAPKAKWEAGKRFARDTDKATVFSWVKEFLDS
ncbi:MAG: hypothetical protein MJ132_05150 [Clostridia bacterium]|nr:hypothetical protein [Clostridia bacterium]